MLDAHVQDNHPRSVPESGGEVQCELLIGSRVSYFLITVATLSRGGAGCRDYRNHLSKFDIFYQNHFFPVQKLLIDLLLLSLSIALAAGGKQGSACKKFVSYLNLINLFYKIKLLQMKAFFHPDLS